MREPDPIRVVRERVEPIATGDHLLQAPPMENHAWTLRVHSEHPESASAFVRHHRFEVGQPLQFDEEYAHVTSLEYVLGALAADVAVGFRRLAKKRRVDVDRVEAVVRGEVDNPLTYLQVVGEEGHAGLTKVAVKLYVSSVDAPERVDAVWDETLRASPLVTTFGSCVELELEHEVVI